MDPPIYNDTGDVTVTLVSAGGTAGRAKSSMWIRGGENDWLHMYTHARGKEIDDQILSRLRGWEKGVARPPPHTPSTSEFDPSELLLSNCQCIKYRGIERDTSDVGKLPSISQLIYDNALGTKSKQQIVDEAWLQSRYNRVADRSDSVATF